MRCIVTGDRVEEREDGDEDSGGRYHRQEQADWQYLRAPPAPDAEHGADAVLEQRQPCPVAPFARSRVPLVPEVEDLRLARPHAGLLLKMSVSVRRSGESRRMRAPDSTAASRMRS